MSNDKMKEAQKLRKKLQKQLTELDKLTGGPKEIRGSNAEYMRRRRREEASIIIPPEINKEHRLELEADPKAWLKFFFPERYYLPFNEVHDVIINEVTSRVMSGGDQAIAAPRGVGKSELCIGLMVYLICARKTKFPVIIAATGELAKSMFEEVKYHLESNDLLAQYYPQICVPIRELEGSSQRAAKQLHAGNPTRIKWDSKYFILAELADSPYAGVACRYFGLDSNFRGIRLRGQRPDFVLVDDPDSESSAVSPVQISTRMKLLTRAVAGLGGQDKKISIVVTTTIQNDYCVSAKVTDPQQYPNFNGKRFGVIKDFPTNTELWDTYVGMRKEDLANGDQTGSNATEYYLKNKEAMDEGATVTSDHRYNSETEHSTLQSCYNFIADRGYDSFMAELQNDPIPDDNIETMGLTPRVVQDRLHFDTRSVVPDTADMVTVGIDIGKYASHWVAIAWDSDICAGRIIDYGVAETVGLGVRSDELAVELAIHNMLRTFREDIIMTMGVMPKAVMIDSGDFTGSVYNFVAEAGSPFFATKGWGSRPAMFVPTGNKDRQYGQEWFASILSNGLVLYNVNVDYWKLWTQQRFITRTYDEGNSLVAGSLSLFAHEGDKRVHHSYAYHICAEEFREEFKEGRGLERKWHKVRRNNHWLDATTYACAASNMLGINLQ